MSIAEDAAARYQPVLVRTRVRRTGIDAMSGGTRIEAEWYTYVYASMFLGDWMRL